MTNIEQTEKPFWKIQSNSSRGLSKRGKIKYMLWQLVSMYLFRTSPPFCKIWRVLLLKVFGAKIGSHCYIAPSVKIQAPWNIILGNSVTIDDDCVLNGSIFIEDFAAIGKNCMFIPDGHDVRSRSFDYNTGTIHIGASCFIGAGTFVGNGVNIGQFSCVGSHSHVLKDIPENTIAFGSPCKVHSERISDEEYKKYRYK